MGYIVFIYKALKVMEYSEQLNTYHVKPIFHDLQFIKQDRLQDFHPLGLHTGFGNNANKLFVVLRCRVDYLQYSTVFRAHKVIRCNQNFLKAQQ